MYICVCVCDVCVCVCVCVRARAYVYVYTICSHCESYNINIIIFFIMKFKTNFEVILISLDEEKFNNDSEQFEFGVRAAR